MGEWFQLGWEALNGGPYSLAVSFVPVLFAWWIVYAFFPNPAERNFWVLIASAVWVGLGYVIFVGALGTPSADPIRNLVSADISGLSGFWMFGELLVLVLWPLAFLFSAVDMLRQGS